MATVWTYPVIKVRSGAPVVDHLPLEVDYFTSALGVAQGAMQCSLPLTPNPAYNPTDATLPMRRVIVPCKNRVPQAPYLITQRPAQGPGARSIKLGALRVDVLLKRRQIQSTLVFRNIDQLAIARDLIFYALGRPTQNVAPFEQSLIEQLPAAADVAWFDMDSNYSGVTRTREDTTDGYQATDHKTVESALTGLMNLEDGAPGTRRAMGFEGSFDFRVDTRATADPLQPYRATLRMGYPALGTGTASLSFEYPGTISDWQYGADTDDTENHSRVYGAGTGPAKIIGAPYIDQQALANEWPLLMGSETSTASDPATLAAAARERGRAYAGVNEGLTIKLSGDVLDQLELGAVANLVIRDDQFDGGAFAQTVRIVGLRVEPPRADRAEVVIPTLVAL